MGTAGSAVRGWYRDQLDVLRGKVAGERVTARRAVRGEYKDWLGGVKWGKAVNAAASGEGKDKVDTS
jgi:hypothetical protein